MAEDTKALSADYVLAVEIVKKNEDPIALEIAIADAIRAERRACAEIADAREQFDSEDAAMNAAARIAHDIRSRGKTPTKKD